ncbi:hypothetical protein LCGC14_2787510 [marine sediment metagenome]|uniref:Uncharacterized protein n=1 Tax=marine sediment metagenome TaxID=412755 RepID=A0A0F8YRF8_9ZZZZ
MYPEHEKLKAIQEQSQVICEFIEWLESGEASRDGACLEIARRDNEFGELESYFENTQPLVVRFFDIDLDKLEEEKRQMLEECRKKT